MVINNGKNNVEIERVYQSRLQTPQNISFVIGSSGTKYTHQRTAPTLKHRASDVPIFPHTTSFSPVHDLQRVSHTLG